MRFFSRRHLRRRAALACSIAFASGLLPGCRGTPAPGERAARSDLDAVSRLYLPDGESRPLPQLTAESSLRDYLTFAMLNDPAVRAAYFQWAASVERITPARTLPDPRLTFEADIADSVLSLMPGLMVDLPGPGKLRAAGEVAAAESRTEYFAFEREVLRAAHDLKIAYYRIAFLDQTLHVQRQTLGLLEDLERLASQQNAAGRVTLQDVLRAQLEREQLATNIENLDDSRGALMAAFKAALGLRREDADPALPERFEASTDEPDERALWQAALARNPTIRQMQADVERAQASIALARTSGVPDATIGLEIDVKPNPTVFQPTASLTLPIWRDRIEAEIAAAQAERHAAEARLSREEVALAAELATAMYGYRESRRTIELLEDRLIPKARQSLDAARAGYVSGRADFLDLIDAERSLLAFDLSLIEARTRRELALAALSLLIAGAAPEAAPILPPQSPETKGNEP